VSLDAVASYAAAIGPWKNSIVELDAVHSRVVRTSDLVDRAHRRGLLVHPFTFRDESRFLAQDWGGDSLLEYRFFVEQVRIWMQGVQAVS
jgi:glycerophosphoryl diester phosphodiesterase